MKSLLFPLLVLLGLFSFSWWNGQYIQTQTAQLQQQIRATDQAVQQAQWDDAQAILAQSHSHWDSCQAYLCTVASHSYLADVEAMYLRAMAFCQTEEPTEFRAELADLHHQLQILGDWEVLSWQNIL